MTETRHYIEQRAARERKRLAAEAREIANKAKNRRVTALEVPKADLLRLLQAEALAPQDATRIIASGHDPQRMTFTVAYD